MNSSIDKLQKLNHSLKLIANTEVKDNEYDSRFQGIGGSVSMPLETGHGIKESEFHIGVGIRTKKDKGIDSPFKKIASSFRMAHLHKTPNVSANKTPVPPYKEVSYPYSVMVGSFRTEERAKNAVTMNRAKGLTSYLVKVDLKEKGVWFRVFAGFFETREEAEKYREDSRLTVSIVKKTRYANLLGNYPAESEAKNQILSLQKSGYDPYVIKDNQNMWRLFVGAFLTEAGAAQQYDDLKVSGFPNRVVQR
ncbi:MAG: SPOR domain-containing protein [Deltaproteobacteria bacterium]|nr:SPOR domain-containing protein [Deltaproteobacteria bacterium]